MNKTLLFIALLCGSSLYAQISGVVVDPRGEPVVGASVVVLNQSVPTTIGTVTDFDGNWSLSIYGKNAEGAEEIKDLSILESLRVEILKWVGILVLTSIIWLRIPFHLFSCLRVGGILLSS